MERPSSPPPAKKPKLPPLPKNATPLERQRHELERLLANPDRAVHIPAPPKEGLRQLRAPREMMKNVQGSSAGAGSGEFHVYKQSRRREYERLKLMDEEEAFNKAKAEAERRQIENETTAEAKTAKNRLKRQKKKQAKKGAKKGETGENSDADSNPDTTRAADETIDKKRKLGGSGFKFKTAEERELEDEAENLAAKGENDAHSNLMSLQNGQNPIPEEIAPAKEAGIFINDED